MLDQFDNDDLKDPKTIRILMIDITNKVAFLTTRLEEDEKILNDPDTGIRAAIKDVNEDVETLNEKLDEILKSQTETRKTVKSVSLTTVLTGVIGTIVAFVMKQLGFY